MYMSWKELKYASPRLADFGEIRFKTEVAYLGTIKKDGSPRVHPVTPIVADEHLFLFMEPTSPKGHDLRRDGRFALHSSVADSSGAGGEFLVTGKARSVEDSVLRSIAEAHASYDPADRYILFELQIDTAFSTIYGEDGDPVSARWKREKS
jgi:hypothetical protein